MKKLSIIFLQIIVVLVGMIVLFLMLWEPHLEGRNVNATAFEIYFNDPFLAYAYVASISFFIALYQTFILLGYIGQNKIFSLDSVKALRTIKYCALSLIGFILGAEAYFFIFQRGKDDITGGVAMGLIMLFVFAITATAAIVLGRILQNALDIKHENDLTV